MAARVVQLLFCALLIAVGGYLGIRGAQLVSLGGSAYYVVAGVSLVAVAALLALRNAWGPRLYAIIVGATVIWALFESGLNTLALLPRLAAFLVIGLWFLSPWHRAAMRKDAETTPQAGGLWVGASVAVGALVLAISAMQTSPVETASATEAPTSQSQRTDWRNYGNTPGGSRFVELTQINATNVSKLKEVWRYRTGVPNDFKNTPLEIDGLVYVCTAGNVVIALDADTGAEAWRHDTHTKVPNPSTFARTCRGLGYHEAPANYTGPCPKRVITATVDERIIAVDAKTGEACKGFGFDGVVSLRGGLGPHPAGMYMVTSAPLIAGDVIVVGGWVTDNQQLGDTSGVVRAFNAMTGQFTWAWDLGNPGNHNQPDEGGEYTRGTPNAWSNMSYDPKLNLIYAPTGNSSPDYFDGELRTEQAEKYASSVVAIDAATGDAKWVYQTVHRDIWDYDVPSQPVLVDVKKDGKVVPSVAVPTKRGEIFLLDRRDGTPVYPIDEKPVPQNPAPGERTSPTQPFSPLPNFRADRLEKNMWGLTPLDQLYCRIEFKKMRYDGHFTPPMPGGGGDGGAPTYGGSFQYPGNAGGFNWGSVSVDADNGLLIAAPMLMGNRIVLRTQDEIKADRAAAAARRAAEAAKDDHAAGGQASTPPKAGAGSNPAGQAGAGPASEQRPPRPVDPRFDPAKVKYVANTAPFMSNWKIPFTKIATSVPCFEPPWSKIAVIDLNANKLLWSRPLGSMKKSGPFGIQSGLPFMVGTPVQSGSITTRGGLIFHGGAMDSTLRAFDLKTGKVLWEGELPGNAHAVPMSYLSPKTNRQFVVITVPNPSWTYPRSPPSDDVGDGKGGYVIAYALPTASAKP